MNPSLAAAVNELTLQHSRTVAVDGGLVTAQEPALLTLLERAKASDTAGAHGGGSARTGCPVDAHALGIWDGISAIVGRWWPGQGDPELKATPLRWRLRMWAGAVAPADEVHLLEVCRSWAAEIREMLEPSKRVPLRGVACPLCSSQYANNYVDGEQLRTAALLVHLSETPPRAECRNCGYTCYGGELLDLGAGLLV